MYGAVDGSLLTANVAEGQADLLKTYTFFPDFFPIRSRAGNHCSAFESPKMAIESLPLRSPRTQILGSTVLYGSSHDISGMIPLCSELRDILSRFVLIGVGVDLVGAGVGAGVGVGVGVGAGVGVGVDLVGVDLVGVGVGVDLVGVGVDLVGVGVDLVGVGVGFVEVSLVGVGVGVGFVEVSLVGVGLPCP